MPKRLSNKDKKNIYCAYKIGEHNNKTKYTNEVYTFQCQFTKFNGIAETNIYGRDISYVAKAIFENTAETRFINEFSQFWQSIKPENGNMAGEYKVTGMTGVVDGLFTVYLNKIVQNNIDLWVLGDDGLIYQIQGLYDDENKILIVPKNTYCPITFHSKIWEIEPEDANSTEGAMLLTYKEEVNNAVKYQFTTELDEYIE